MTTTETLHIKPYVFLEKKKWKNNIQTNHRYKHFKQSIFTAGDEEQFEYYRCKKSHDSSYSIMSKEENEIIKTKNIYSGKEIYIWKKYMNLDAIAVTNTFRYMFYKFKKGIFVKIVNNKLRVFLPFSNVRYINEWGNKIKIDKKKYKTVEEFISKMCKISGYRYKYGKVNKNINEWYGNNCLLRYEYPIQENNTNIPVFKNMMEELCLHRKIPDIEFFINRRDFPLLTRNETEPYDNIWNSKKQKLVSHNYEQYAPILSMSASEINADLMIPTWDDWSRISRKEGKWFSDSSNQNYNIIDIEWEKKKPTAVFRGSATGIGVTIERNMRLKVAYISKFTELDENGIPYIDAGITNWKIRPRKLSYDKYLRFIEKDDIPFGLVKPLTIEEQCKYKYIINIDGHVTAFRLSLELGTKSVLLIVKSDWKIWFSDFLVPYIHYVPIKRDLSDLIEKIKWCRNNDEKCKQIAKNAYLFYKTYLQKDGILDYMQHILIQLKRKMGIYVYNSCTPLDTMINLEYKELKGDVSSSHVCYPIIKQTFHEVNTIPKTQQRTYSLLKGIEWTILKLIKESKIKFDKLAKYKGIFFENKSSIIKEFELAGFSVLVKTTSNDTKIKEYIHETFVGMKQLNNLAEYIPNFAYIFGIYNDGDDDEVSRCYSVISEKIEGVTLYEYIKNKKYFDLNEFLFIIIQLCLSIQVAQNKCGLVHYDLTPWNIIVQRLKNHQTIDYILSHKKVVRVYTNVIPVIIDYGKSHIIHKQIHHGFMNMFKVSTCQDFLTILIKSLKEIIDSHVLSQYELADVFTLANFITGTQYRPNQFKNVRELRYFLNNAGKYSNILYNEKYELENKKPCDLIDYILIHMNKNIIFGKNIFFTKNYIPIANGNSRQIFEYIFSNSTDEYIRTYLNFFYNTKRCISRLMYNHDTLLFVYYIAQTLENVITTVYKHMICFLQNNNYTIIDSKKYTIVFNSVIELLKKTTNFYKKNNYQEIVISYNNKFLVNNTNRICKSNYTEESFLIPSKIYSLLINNNDYQYEQNDDISEYKEIIQMILVHNGKFKLNNNEYTFYTNMFEQLLEIDSLNMKNTIANDITLLYLSKIIYNNDYKSLRNATTATSVSTNIDKYKTYYNKILNYEKK